MTVYKKMTAAFMTASLLCGVLIWVLDAVIDSLFFYRRPFLDMLITDVPAHEIYVRSLTVAILLAAGFLASRFLTRHRAYRGLFSAVIEATPRAIIVTDLEGRVILWNPGAEKMFGWTESEALSRPLPVFEGKNTDDIGWIMEQVRNGISIDEIETVGADRHGRPMNLRLSSGLTESPESGSPAMVFVLADVTEQKKTLAALRDSEATLKSVFRASPVGIGLVKDRVLGPFNEFVSKMTGYGPSELEGQSARILYPDEEEFQKVGREKHPLVEKYGFGTVETRWRKKDGEVIDVLLSSAILAPGDLSAGLVYTALDITESKRHETLIKNQKEELEAANEELAATNEELIATNEELEQINDELAQTQRELLEINRRLADSEEHYRLLAENSTDIIWTMSLEGRFNYVSPSVTALSGFTVDEMLNMTMYDYIPPEQARFAAEFIAQELAKPPAERLERYTLETSQYTKAGEVIDIEISCSWLYDREGNTAGIQGSTRDIRQRKIIQEKLRVSNQRLGALINSSPLAIFTLDRDGKVLQWNAAAEKVFGWTEEEILNRYLPVVPEDKREEYDSLRALVFSGRSMTDREIRRIRKDGSPAVLSLNTAPLYDADGKVNAIMSVVSDITDRKRAEDALRASEEKFSRAFHTSPDSININRVIDGLYLDINDGFTAITGYTREDVIGKSSVELDIWADPRDRERLVEQLRKTGEAVGLEARFRMKDGKVIEGLMSARVITIEGEPCILSITRDISERKAAEENIRRSLREKEVLLREIHHRVKNNLGVIYSMLHFQKEAVGDGAVAEILETTKNRVKSMALVHQKLYGSEEVSVINFAEYCDELMGQLMKSVKRPDADIGIKLNVEEALLDIDTVLPCGLIINELVTNSLKYAFSDTGKGTISLNFNRVKEDHYLLRVSDDGRGMPEARADRPAKTLGMFIVESLTKQLGGTMEISSGPGVSVAVSFPVKENTPAAR